MSWSPDPHRALRTAPGRMVTVEGAAVVKSFRAANAWRRLRDRRRATHEHDTLRYLSAAGVAVPESLGVERRGTWWCLLTKRLVAARTLEQWLDARSEASSVPELSVRRAAQNLGELVASLHAAGLEHRDLHPGNLMLDSAGGAWAIDFARAQRRRRLTPPQILGSLARLGGATSERVDPRLRWRFFRAWWSALPNELRDGLGQRATVVHRVEQLAREDRRRDVLRNLGRWLRPSGRLRRSADGRWLLARDAVLLGDERLAQRRAEIVQNGRSHGAIHFEGSARNVRNDWLAAARAFEHRLTPIVPLAIASDFGRAVLALNCDLAPAPDRADWSINAALEERGIRDGLLSFEAWTRADDGRLVARARDVRSRKRTRVEGDSSR